MPQDIVDWLRARGNEPRYEEAAAAIEQLRRDLKIQREDFEAKLTNIAENLPIRIITRLIEQRISSEYE